MSGTILKSKARLIADAAYGTNSFTASNGWLESFLNRHRITYKALSGEGADVNEQTVNDWITRLPTLCHGYNSSDIFNMDETGLFYKTLPKKTFAAATDKC